MRFSSILLFLLFATLACNSPEKTIGSIERIDPSLDSIVSADAKIEIIGEGYEWSEGPLWVGSYNMLLFSDVPKNIIYKWTQEKGVENPAFQTGLKVRKKSMSDLDVAGVFPTQQGSPDSNKI